VRNEIQRERLIDYSNREKEEASKYFSDLRNTAEIRYPSETRFLKLNNPVSISHPGNIWSKIPIYGSTIIGLAPIPQQQFIERFGWGKDVDILNLVELAKDSGRVQFRLISDPLHFEGLGYLDPILEELNPPVVYNTAKHVFRDNRSFYVAYLEFMTVANIKFIPFMETLYSTLEYRSKRIDDYATDYAMLKMLGYHDVAHHILDLLIDDPNLASYLFTIYGNLIVAPATDPMRGYHPNMCYDKEDYSRQIMTLRQSRLNNINSLTHTPR